MVVPLATSNSFAPLADDDDRPSSSRPATSAMEPPSTPDERRVTWAEVMAALSAQRTVTDALGMDADIADGWTFSDHHATTSSRDPPTYFCNRLIGSRPELVSRTCPSLCRSFWNFQEVGKTSTQCICSLTTEPWIQMRGLPTGNSLHLGYVNAAAGSAPWVSAPQRLL